MLIDATQTDEIRVVVTSGNRVEDFDFEVASRRPLKGNIYLAQVTRVEPSLQAAFVEYGGNRHGFLAFSEIHADYYRIPMEDREALLAEQAADIARRWIFVIEDLDVISNRKALRLHDGNGIFREQCEWVKMLEHGGEFAVRAVGEMQPIDSSARDYFSRTHADVWHAQRYFLAERRTYTTTTALPGNGQTLDAIRQRCCSMCKSSKC